MQKQIQSLSEFRKMTHSECDKQRADLGVKLWSGQSDTVQSEVSLSMCAFFVYFIASIEKIKLVFVLNVFCMPQSANWSFDRQKVVKKKAQLCEAKQL